MGALSLAKDELARKTIQYPVRYVITESGKRNSRGLSTVNVVAKKKETNAIDELKGINHYKQHNIYQCF